MLKASAAWARSRTSTQAASQFDVFVILAA